jgi:hypothetical protein
MAVRMKVAGWSGSEIGDLGASPLCIPHSCGPPAREYDMHNPAVSAGLLRPLPVPVAGTGLACGAPTQGEKARQGEQRGQQHQTRGSR